MPADGASDRSARKLVYRSSLMRQVDEAITKVARTERSVLITGETGTGKELVARAIHERSRRARGPFIAVNISALPESLIASELFGVGKDMATGVKAHQGYLHKSRGGTLFIDEVGDIPLSFQVILLRPLQENKFCRVGEREEVDADVRFVSATNRDLEAAIQRNNFRSDFFHRLSAHEIRIPPLRERREDIALLAAYFCAECAREDGTAELALSPEALRLLEKYAWPGNVRELENTIRKAVTNCDQQLVLADHLPDLVRTGTRRPSPSASQPPKLASPEAMLRTRPPFPSDPQYERLPRPALVQEVLTNHLRGARVATLLQTHRGGGRTLARQIAPLCYGMTPIWLTDYSSETSSPEEFYRMLTGRSEIRNQAEFGDWLMNHVADRGVLVILLGTQGPADLLEEVAAQVRSLLAGHHPSAFLVVGGERLLRLRNHDRYSWYRLLPASSFVDVPDLGEQEVTKLLVARNQPAQRAAMLWQATGGHPWLLYELMRKGVITATLANETVRYQLSLTHKLSRHLADPQAMDVIRRLLNGHDVASLADPCVRHEPALFAEARMYFDGLLRWDRDGKTQFRGDAVRHLLETGFAKQAEP